MMISDLFPLRLWWICNEHQPNQASPLLPLGSDLPVDHAELYSISSQIDVFVEKGNSEEVGFATLVNFSRTVPIWAREIQSRFDSFLLIFLSR